MAAHEISEAIAELVKERERLTGAPDPDADFFQLELDAEHRSAPWNETRTLYATGCARQQTSVCSVVLAG